MQIFENVWDALEDDPIKAKNLKIRSELMIAVEQKIREDGLSQSQAAELLGTTQARVSALLNGKFNDFRLDVLVNYAHALGLTVNLDIAA